MNEVNGTNKEFDVVEFVMAYEGEDLTDAQIIEGFQGLIDSGMAWTLQGSYGRMAAALIEAGHCHAKGNPNDTNKPIDATTDGIKVEGHRGTWYVLDEVIFEGTSYFLLEHETYGEDADHIAIDATGYNVFSHITDGTAELLERLQEREEESDEMKEQRDWFTEVSYKRAIEIFEEGGEVFCLYDDGSEGLVEAAERIDEHFKCGGRFGVE